MNLDIHSIGEWQSNAAIDQGNVMDKDNNDIHCNGVDILLSMIVHTYIIGHYNPSVRIIDLISHTTYIVCVNFIYERRDLQLQVDSKRPTF